MEEILWTKRNLTTHYMQQLEKHFRLSNQWLVITRNGKTVWSWQNQTSINNNELAKTLIPFFQVHFLGKICGRRKSAVVHSNDTNMFALLVSHALTLSYEQLYMKWGVDDINGIHKICERSRVPLYKSLIDIHSFTEHGISFWR